MNAMLQPRYSTKVHRAVRAPRRYFFDREAETMPRDALEKLQLRRLRAMLKDARAHVALHRNRLQAGVALECVLVLVHVGKVRWAQHDLEALQ